MRRILTMLASAAAIVTASSAANAAPILAGSTINLNGYVIGSGGGTLGSSTSLDFTEESGVATPGVAGVLTSYGSGSGTFLGLTCGTGNCGSIKDISSFVTGAQAIASFVSLVPAGITFDLSNITDISSSAGGLILTFTADGTINYAGYDSTPGQFIFTAQGNQVTSFSGTSLAGNAVPEPGTWMMMLLGFGALGLVMRKKQSAASGRRLAISSL